MVAWTYPLSRGHFLWRSIAHVHGVIERAPWTDHGALYFEKNMHEGQSTGHCICKKHARGAVRGAQTRQNNIQCGHVHGGSGVMSSGNMIWPCQMPEGLPLGASIAMQCSVMQRTRNSMPCSVKQWTWMQRDAMQLNTMRCDAMQCNVI